MSASERLRAKIALALPRTVTTAVRIREHPRLHDLVPLYLVVLHQMVRATVPLLEQAAAACTDRAPRDPLARALRPYFETHAGDERHHDSWLLDDLAVLGWHPSDVLSIQPAPEIAALVGAQYYWLNHHHPVALLGYIAVAEGYPPSIRTVEALARRSGRPLAAFASMMIHARIDPRHRAEFDVFVDSLPLTPTHESIVGVSALATVGAENDAFTAMLDRFDRDAVATAPL